MPYKDPEKRRINRRKYIRQYRLKVDHVINEFRRKGCRKCKEKCPDCLCAHHRDPKKKSFGIGSISQQRPTLDILRAELKKCTCLCLNCHAKLHARKRRREKRDAR